MFVILADAAEPPFEQLRRQVRDAALVGRLVPGERLPSVRALATELGIAPGTVARAYRELEADGVVETHGRGGTIVAYSRDASRRALEQAAADYAARTRALGVDAADALAAARAALGSQPRHSSRLEP